MKKVISIAVSTLLLSNVSFADTPNTDSTVLQSIQQKTDNKKSNLGVGVQSNSGLSGFTKNSGKNVAHADSSQDSSSPSMSSSVTTNTTTTTSSPASSLDSSKSDTKTEVKSVDIKKVVTSSAPATGELCDPPKPVVKKHIVRKHIVKKVVVVKKVEKNDFDMVKTQNYTPVDFSSKNHFITDSQVKLSLKYNARNIEVSISDMNGEAIPKEQFNKSFVRVVQVSQNFKTVNHQEDEMNFSGTNYEFKKELHNCGAVFVQYHLKGDAIPTNLVKYVDKMGGLSDYMDTSCKQINPEDTSTDLNYSSANNLSGLFFKNNKLISSRPIAFNIIYSKEGITRIPTDLFVFALKTNFSDLRVMEPKSYGDSASGVSYENKFEAGHYVLGYTFNEPKMEKYFTSIDVQ